MSSAGSNQRLKTASPSSAQEQNIPIEIAATKLLDWLESRKIVPKKWDTAVHEIRAKIASALNDMPVHEDLVKLLSGACKCEQ